MPQQLELDGLDVEIGNEFQRRRHLGHGVERFLMAMAVQESPFFRRHERQVELARGGLARQKFLEQQRAACDLARRFAFQQRRYFVAEAEQAARLQSDDRRIGRGERRQRGERPFHFPARFVHLADGEKGAAAAERARAFNRLCHRDAISAGGKHRERGVDIFALEIAIEGVGEQDDVTFAPPSCPALCRASTSCFKKDVDGRDEPGHDDLVSSNQSERHFGRLRCALKPAMASDNLPAPGTTSRRLSSQDSFAAVGA